MKTHQEIHAAIEKAKRFGADEIATLDILHALNDRIEAVFQKSDQPEAPDQECGETL